MHNVSEYGTLVADALYGRNIQRQGCFVTNQASTEAKRIGAAILPNIELAIFNDVIKRGPISDEEQFTLFPGLSDLLVTYFQIVKEFGETMRAADFFASTHGAVFVDSVRAIIQIWHQDVPVPFLKKIVQTAKIGSPDEQRIARWALEWHSKKG